MTVAALFLAPWIPRFRLQRAKAAPFPAEFFAVAAETVFEKPERMRRRRHRLFDLLKSYDRIDPNDWKIPRSSEAVPATPGA